jgi:hypothetical protein
MPRVRRNRLAGNRVRQKGNYGEHDIPSKRLSTLHKPSQDAPARFIDIRHIPHMPSEGKPMFHIVDCINLVAIFVGVIVLIHAAKEAIQKGANHEQQRNERDST